MKVFYLIFILVGLSSEVVFAGANVVPVKTEVINGRTQITQQLASWSETDNVLNPCYGTSKCYIGLDVSYRGIGNPTLYGTCQASNCLEISTYKTAKEVLNAYAKQFGIPYVATFFQSTGKEALCTGLFYVPHEPQSLDSGTDPSVQLWPNSTCGMVPPPDQNCSLELPGKIDFGDMDLVSLENAPKKHITGTIKCSSDANFKLYGFSATNVKKVCFDGNDALCARLLINEDDAYNGVPISVNANLSENFDFSVSLEKNGAVNPGDYTATALVIAVYQ